MNRANILFHARLSEWTLGVVMSAAIFFVIKRWKKNSTCPKCKKYIAWKYRRKFSRWYCCGFKVAPCPHCTTPLVWESKPALIINLATLVAIIYATLFAFFCEYKHYSVFSLGYAGVLVGIYLPFICLGTVYIALTMLKYKIADKPQA